MPSIWIGGFLIIIHTADHDPQHVHVRLGARGGPEIRVCLTDAWLPDGEWDYLMGKMKANDISRALKRYEVTAKKCSRCGERITSNEKRTKLLHARKAS